MLKNHSAAENGLKKVQIITIANQKGGVGKTTTAVNLAAALALIYGKKILLVDMDAQGNATTSMGLDKNTLSTTIADVLLGDATLAQAMIALPDLDMIPGNRELAGLDLALAGQENAPLLLMQALAQADLSAYDYVIIDAPPSLSLVTVNALAATDGVIIPMQCEYYALEGVADLLYTIDKLKAINTNLAIKGVVRTLFDSRNMLSQDVSLELERYFGELLYKTIIPRNIRLAEAPSFGVSIFSHQKSSKGAIAYQNLAKELLLQDKQ